MAIDLAQGGCGTEVLLVLGQDVVSRDPIARGDLDSVLWFHCRAIPLVSIITTRTIKKGNNTKKHQEKRRK